MTVPTLTRDIDDYFVETWYEIRAEAIDNVLDATVMWLALREHGSLTPQTGGEFITRTIKYGEKSGQNISKGKTLKQSVAQRETMALWDWAYCGIDVNRTLIDDQKNSGPSKIKDYVSKRILGANDDLTQKMEDDLFAWNTAAVDQMNGLLDFIRFDDMAHSTNADAMPNLDITPIANPQGAAGANDLNTGTFGNINRGTYSWWRNKAWDGATEPTNPEVNLKSDMNHFYNLIGDNIAPPNFIISDQDLYEYYEEDVMEKVQIVRTSFNRTAADLGFETTTFKGKPMSWTSKLSGTSKMMFLNLDFIEVVYDPDYFFMMTEWMYTANQLERVAYIVSAMQLIDSQPRRHGCLDYSTTTNQ